MKTIYFIFAIFYLEFSAKSEAVYSKENNEIHSSISRQLASVISYPKVLGSTHAGGIVVLEFYLTDGVYISRVKVYSENDALNSELIRQLTGKKLRLSEPNLFEKITVRLVFKNRHVDNYKTGTKATTLACFPI